MAFSENASAWTSGVLCRWPRIDGSATSLPTTSRATASTDPARPCSSPSSMNGPRTNQLVAPTSFITSISRRRAKIAKRIVFAISSVEEITRITTAMMKKMSIHFATSSSRCAVFLP